jgi:hypothetical protein
MGSSYLALHGQRVFSTRDLLLLIVPIDVASCV